MFVSQLVESLWRGAIAPASWPRPFVCFLAQLTSNGFGSRRKRHYFPRIFHPFLVNYSAGYVVIPDGKQKCAGPDADLRKSEPLSTLLSWKRLFDIFSCLARNGFGFFIQGDTAPSKLFQESNDSGGLDLEELLALPRIREGLVQGTLGAPVVIELPCRDAFVGIRHAPAKVRYPLVDGLCGAADLHQTIKRRIGQHIHDSHHPPRSVGSGGTLAEESAGGCYYDLASVERASPPPDPLAPPIAAKETRNGN